MKLRLKDLYTSQAIFELEQKYIFSDTWMFAGFSEDITDPDDYLVCQVGHCSLFVIRTNDGEINAFHNHCRHRGAELLEGTGRINGQIKCPYHDWKYDRSGDLIKVPKQRKEFRELDLSCLGLKKANCIEYRGMIWVHPNPGSKPFMEWLSGMETKLGPHKVEALIEAEDDRVEVDIQANWKLIVENYIDPYHLSHLHLGTLSMYRHDKAKFGFKGNHFHFWEPMSSEYFDNLAKKSPMPLIDEAVETPGAWTPMLFPGIGIAASESSWSLFHVIPLTVDKTRVVIRTKVANKSSLAFIKQAAVSSGYWYNNTRAKDDKYPQDHPLGSADFMQEDVYICEQVQKSLLNPHFAFGPSAATLESPIRHHQKVVQLILDRALSEPQY